MKSRVAVLLLLIFGVVLYQWRKPVASSNRLSIEDEVVSATAAPVSKNSEVPAGVPSTNAGVALGGMTDALFRFTRPHVELKDLVDYLEVTHQVPVTLHNSNPFTGEMAIVRTENPMRGTRYFHAQYFKGESGEGFLQHMSFEFQPGPSAMADAIRAVEKSFALAAPKVGREDYAQWSLDDGYVIWVKKMAFEDLKDDPFNAYTPEDVGTIRVAVEAEVH